MYKLRRKSKVRKSRSKRYSRKKKKSKSKRVYKSSSKSKFKIDGGGDSSNILHDINQTLKKIQEKIDNMPTFDQIDELMEYIKENVKKT